MNASELCTTITFEKIIEHADECVEKLQNDRVYLCSETIQLLDSHFVLEFQETGPILLPTLYMDESGYFVSTPLGYKYWKCKTSECNRLYSGEYPPRFCGKCWKSNFQRYIP